MAIDTNFEHTMTRHELNKTEEKRIAALEAPNVPFREAKLSAVISHLLAREYSWDSVRNASLEAIEREYSKLLPAVVAATETREV